MTILEEARHTLIIIEHDPLLYEDAAGMIDLASQAMSDAAKEASVLLCSPGTDTFLEDLTRNADRVFYFDEGPRANTKLIATGSEEPDHPGGLDMIKLPWKRGARPIEPRIRVNPRLLELENGKKRMGCGRSFTAIRSHLATFLSPA